MIARPTAAVRLRRLLSDRRGMAAVEFAMVLPFLLAVYLGGFELSQAAEAYRKVGTTAETVGNLVTSSTSLSDTQIDNIFNISGAVMAPLPADGLSILVSAENIDANGKCTIDHERSNKSGVAVRASGAACTAPAELSSLRSTYFIVTQATYAYKSSTGFGNWLPATSMKKTYTFRPRKSEKITWQ